MRSLVIAFVLVAVVGLAVAGPAPPEVGDPPQVDGLYGDYHWALEVDGVRVAWFKQIEGIPMRVAISEDPQGRQEARLVPVDGVDPLFERVVPGGGVTTPAVASWLGTGLTPGRREMRLVPWLHDRTPTLPAGAQCGVRLGRGMISEVRLEAEWKGRHRLAMTLVGDGGAIEDDCERLRQEPAKRSASAAEPDQRSAPAAQPEQQPQPEQ